MNDLSRWVRWKMRGRRLLVILLLSVIVVLVVRAVFDVWEGWRLNEEVASLGKRYGSLDDWHIGPPRVARAENRARLLAAAANSLTTSEPDLVAALNARWRSPANLMEAQAKKVLAENRDAIELAIRAARRPRSNWQIQYEFREWAGPVPPLLDLRRVSDLLEFAAREDTAAGRADDAAADVTAGFAEAASLRGEPNTIINVVATGIAAAQVRALQEVLARSDPSSAALEALASAVEENLVEHPLRPAMIAELKLARSHWSRIERGQLESGSRVPTPLWKAAVAWLLRPVVRFVARRDLSDRANAIDVVSTPRTRRAAIVRPPQGSERPWWSPSRWLSVAGLPIQGYWYPEVWKVNSADTDTAVVRLSAVAVALRRFRLDRGAYPDSLGELAPAYLKAVPLDPFTGRQPEYARQGAGFELRAQVPGPPFVAALGEWKVPR